MLINAGTKVQKKERATPLCHSFNLIIYVFLMLFNKILAFVHFYQFRNFVGDHIFLDFLYGSS